MRTKGKWYRRRWPGSHGIQGSLYISPDKRGDKRTICSFGGGCVQYAEAEENSSHVLACYAAIESIGGKPETVAELVTVVRECGRFCTFRALQALLAKLPETTP